MLYYNRCVKQCISRHTNDNGRIVIVSSQSVCYPRLHLSVYGFFPLCILLFLFGFSFSSHNIDNFYYIFIYVYYYCVQWCCHYFLVRSHNYQAFFIHAFYQTPYPSSDPIDIVLNIFFVVYSKRVWRPLNITPSIPLNALKMPFIPKRQSERARERKRERPSLSIHSCNALLFWSLFLCLHLGV